MTNQAEKIARKITDWDRASVRDLRDMINDLYAHCKLEGVEAEQYIDLTSLPTVDIPADVDTSYPVWAMDRDGNLLVGDTAQDIETLADYRAWRDGR